MLRNKKILIGITGSIAAYKIASLVRLFIKEGAEVRVVMTPAATNFITALTLSTLSKNPVYSDVSSSEGWNNHVELGLWADVMIVAPATANTLSAMANGQCNNMLLAVYLSSRCPVFFAPAMDLDMWTHPATQGNVDKLLSYGNHLIPVEDGFLASGLVGKGRMAEPEHIVDCIYAFFAKEDRGPFSGKKVMITSGPTVEAIDPVRYISNHSTGKMGTAIAQEMAEQGAEVILITGPSKEVTKHPNIIRVDVKSAGSMYMEAMKHFPSADITILAAAVADYTPTTVANKKIKKKTANFNIEMEKTQDIAASLGALKEDGQLMVGFALETNDAVANALGKLERKNLDFIVLNTLEDEGAGFGHDTNKVQFLDKFGEKEQYPLKSKKEVAVDIVHKIQTMTTSKVSVDVVDNNKTVERI